MRRPVKNGRASEIVSCLILTVLLAAFPANSFTQNRKNQADYDRLTQKAWSEGYVRIIVHLDVPRIEELTVASTKFLGADANASVTWERTSADTALKDAIEYTAWKVLADLQGTEYSLNAIYRSIPYMALRVSPYTLALLVDSAAVLGIEEDVPIRLTDPVAEEGGGKGGITPPDNGDLDRPFLSTSVPLVGATTAWGWGYTGSGWYVAILDTGIRKTHQFFTGKTIVEACFAQGYGSGGSGDCPNGKSTMTGPGSAVHYSSTYEGYDHGTHVSGIAAGNYGSLAGVAKNANIIAVQVFSKFSASDCGGSPCIASLNSDTLAGLDYIYSIRGSYNIAAVNMSLGGSTRYSSSCDSDSRKASIDNLRSVGIATCIATGNNGWCTGISAPACISTSVSVGSSTKSDYESYFNNWHATLQKLFAPGSSIYSSTGASDSSYASWDGTSMATPHVTGAWALMKQSKPSGSVTEFLNALRSTGKSIYSVCDSYTTGVPRIQVDKAIATFASFALTIQSDSNGTTNPVPGTYAYAQGAQVQITATPNTNCEFVNWTGSISSTQNPVTVTMDADKTVRANFRVKPKLTIQSSSNGTTNPIPGDYYYATGAQVQVTAVPNTNCELVNWTGSISSTQTTVTVTMDADKTIKANFRVKPILTIQSSSYGTTNPSPGGYYYATGSQAQVSAIPDMYAVFINWTGSASGSDNPLSLTMNGDKTIMANFRYIYAPIASGQKVLNRTFSQAEYIDLLTWTPNPANAGLDIAKYRIYQMSGGTPTLLAELAADQSTYSRRNAGQASNQYAITAVMSSGSEGAPATVTVQ